MIRIRLELIGAPDVSGQGWVLASAASQTSESALEEDRSEVWGLAVPRVPTKQLIMPAGL